MNAWEEKEEGPPKNNMAAEGEVEQRRLELLERGTPCSLRPAKMEAYVPPGTERIQFIKMRLL